MERAKRPGAPVVAVLLSLAVLTPLSVHITLSVADAPPTDARAHAEA